MTNLHAIPSLDELADHPERVVDLPVDVVKVLLVKHASLGQVLLTALLSARPNVQEEPDYLISVEDAARLVKMRPRWIYDHKDELPFVVHNGRSVRCSYRGVMDYIRSRARA